MPKRPSPWPRSISANAPRWCLAPRAAGCAGWCASAAIISPGCRPGRNCRASMCPTPPRSPSTSWSAARRRSDHARYRPTRPQGDHRRSRSRPDLRGGAAHRRRWALSDAAPRRPAFDQLSGSLVLLWRRYRARRNRGGCVAPRIARGDRLGSGDMTLFTEHRVVLPFAEPRRETIRFFAVPIDPAEASRLKVKEGAGLALLHPAELAAKEKVIPWDLAAVLMHAGRATLFRTPRPTRDP